MSSPPGSVIGTVEQEWSFIYPRCLPGAPLLTFPSSSPQNIPPLLPLPPRFVIKDQGGSPVLRIEGPLCPISCCGDVDFKVVTMEGQEVSTSHFQIR